MSVVLVLLYRECHVCGSGIIIGTAMSVVLVVTVIYTQTSYRST